VSPPLLFSLPGNDALASLLTRELGAVAGELEIRRFPDGETYVRYRTNVHGRRVILLCTLNQPDEKFLPLMFCATAARNLGARSVGVVAPYLAYLRQDRRFHPGEAVTSRSFAALLSHSVDWLVTVDPHLHRIRSLSDVYSVPAVALQSAPLLAEWIGRNVERPLLIGPDIESEQWAASVAERSGAPFVTLEKVRHGDRAVDVTVPDLRRWSGHTPVLVDDIISTAGTMVETLCHLSQLGQRPPACVAVHGLFAGNAYDDLRRAGAAMIATTNSVPHPTNAIDLSRLIADGVAAVMPGELR
jgi:ribose-phosphate pyrophosphokinase